MDAVTYCNDAGTACSWIDHVLCTPLMDGLVGDVDVMEEFVSSDHKPLAVTLQTLVGLGVSRQESNSACSINPGYVIEWSKVDELCIQTYKTTLDSMLSSINIPVVVDRLSECVHSEIDAYYHSLMSCVGSRALA